MKSLFAIFLWSLAMSAYAQTPQRTVLFDDNWLFIKRDDAAAAQPNYNDASWRRVDLPHDWSIEDLPGQAADSVRGPFIKSAQGGMFTAYTVGGVGWYRKKFTVTPGKQVLIDFDGVYMHAEVWINGHYLGVQPYGYTPFNYNITPWLTNGENVIALRVANLGQNSRWYSGSGIYRHVWLTYTEPLHIAPWGVYITTPAVSNNSALVQAQITLQNNNNQAGEAMVTATLLSPAGKKVASAKTAVNLSAGMQNPVVQNFTVNNPALWSTDKPVLYTMKVVVNAAGKNVDSVTVKTGIRAIAFTTGGFMLNGKRTILKGGCVHQDNGPLGAAAFDRAEERKLQTLKANGYNAIRTSHNPPSKSFLDICDSLGLLVMDEFFDEWEEPKLFKDSFAYHNFYKEWWQKDVDNIMLRDRNHPSVIMWSIGNEIHERGDTNGVRIAEALAKEVRRMDYTRAVTEGVCWFWDHAGRHWDSTYKAFAPLDVGGYNYEWKRYVEDHQKHPGRIMAGTETYALDALEDYTAAEKLPYVTGGFLWTAVDYMGETGIGHSKLQPVKEADDKAMLNPWPWYNAWCGDIDIVGFKKPQSYYRDVVWRMKDIEMLVHTPIPAGMKETLSQWGWPDEQHSWTWPGNEGKPMQVRVFTRSGKVRLLLNGKVIGEKQIPADSITAVFEVPYAPGELKTIAIENGKEKSAVTLTTTGKPTQVLLTADNKAISAGRNNICYVTVAVADAAKQLVINSDKTTRFSISGPGEIIGVGNADPAGMRSFQQPVMDTYKGRCIVIVRSTGKAGKIQLTANTEGLPAQQIVVNAR